MARIEIRQLCKVFGSGSAQPVCALDNLNLEVVAKEWLVVTGPSGCGKTTLLRLIAGLDWPTSGEVSMDGVALDKVPPHERDVAMVFQEPALYPHMTVAENIAFGLKLRRRPAAEVREQVRWAAEMLGVMECLQRRPMELSGGQRHRVAIARALVRRPAVFLFDEPLGSLDAPTRELLRSEIRRVCHTVGATVVYVTHDQFEAMALGDRVAVIERGRLQQVGRPLEIYTCPANLFVARFLGSPPMNVCAGRLAGTGAGLHFEADGWRLRLEDADARRLASRSGEAVLLAVRPEAIMPAQAGTSPEPLDAAVESVEELGAEKRLRLVLGGHPFVARIPSAEPVSAPGRMRICFKAGSLRFFEPTGAQAVL